MYRELAEGLSDQPIFLTRYSAIRALSEQLAAPLYTPVPAMTVGHDTTRIDGPLDENGYVDYIAALEAESRRGVTPEENGAAAFYRIIGPATIPAAEREEFFGRLGILVQALCRLDDAQSGATFHRQQGEVRDQVAHAANLAPGSTDADLPGGTLRAEPVHVRVTARRDQPTRPARAARPIHGVEGRA